MSWYLAYGSSYCLSEKDKRFLCNFMSESCFVEYIKARIPENWFLQKDKITLLDILKELEYVKE